MSKTIQEIETTRAEIAAAKEQLSSILSDIRNEAITAITADYLRIAQIVGRENPVATNALGKEGLQKLLDDVKAARASVPAIITKVLDDQWITKCFESSSLGRTHVSSEDISWHRLQDYTQSTAIENNGKSPYIEVISDTIKRGFEPLAELLRKAGFGVGVSGTSMSFSDRVVYVARNYSLGTSLKTLATKLGEVARNKYILERKLVALKSKQIEESAASLWDSVDKS